MVDIKEHFNKMNEIKKQISNSKGKQRRNYLKCLHRLQKELKLCNTFLRGDING